MSDTDRVAGIISERDVVRAVAREGHRALERKIADLMTRNVVFATPEDTVEQVMAMMTERHIRHLPVQDRGRLTGPRPNFWPL